MTIAVTGGTGFVGSRFLDLAVQSGRQVRALARRLQQPRDCIEWVEGSLEDPDSLRRLVTGCTAVVHVAGVINARDGAGFQRGMAMGGGGGHQHDRLARQHLPEAVDDQAGVQRPAGQRLGLDPLQLALGHAGIMLERHRGEPAPAGELAHQAGEGRDPADPGIAGGQLGQFLPDIERLGLDPHRHRLSPR